jgi:hypothetical protein
MVRSRARLNVGSIPRFRRLSLSVRVVLMAATWAIWLSATAWAQDSESPNSLGDLAHQRRAQHTSAPADKSGKAQGLVDEMQREQEESENAPTGFKNYNAGDYWVFVPFPFSLEGRENGGAVLLGSRLGITNTEVLAGTPVSIPANLSDNDLVNAARGLAGQHGQSPSCSPIESRPTQSIPLRMERGTASAGPPSLGIDGDRSRVQQADSRDVRQP